MPWSLALLRTQKELVSKWDQGRDFRTLHSANRTLKGDGHGRGAGQDVGGEGSHGRGDVKAKPGKKRYERYGSASGLASRDFVFVTAKIVAVFDLHLLLEKLLCNHWNVTFDSKALAKFVGNVTTTVSPSTPDVTGFRQTGSD